MLKLCLSLCVAFASPPATRAYVAYPEVVILGTNDPTDLESLRGQSIGQISYSHPSAYAYVESEEQILETLRIYAHNHGANLVKIVLDQHPRRGSSGKITAELYKVDNPQQYEPWIEWSAERRLTLADFKALPNQSGTAHIDCAFYLVSGSETHTRFYTKSSWIDSSGGTADRHLLHEQGAFDLCELYRERLDSLLKTTYPGHRSIYSGHQSIYRQVYKDYVDTREKYERETDAGIDSTQQRIWTERIAAGAFPPTTVLTHRELTRRAHDLPSSPDRALLYIIRPNQYNSPILKRIVTDPYCIFPCPYFLFLNPESYSIDCNGVTMGPFGVRKFMYRYLPADTCTITPTSGELNLTLPLVAGKVYFVKMKLMERHFFAGAQPELELLDERRGKRWLSKCRLARNWQYFALPVFPDPLR
jgi:hypothetical protein